MIQIISNLVATFVVGAFCVFTIYYIWTGDVDVYRTIIKPLTAIIQIKEHNSIQLDEQNILLSRYMDPDKGTLALLFYRSITFINRTDHNLTIKSVHLRFVINSEKKELDSFYIPTGEVKTHEGPKAAIIINKTKGERTGMVILMRWKK
jgi:hypothetical protein